MDQCIRVHKTPKERKAECEVFYECGKASSEVMALPPKPWERVGDVNHRQLPYQPDQTPS